jgi:hypothetical protein
MKTVDDFLDQPGTDHAPVECPRCSSHQVHAGKRGWTVWTGPFGMSDVILTCLKCGRQFRPGAFSWKEWGLLAVVLFVLWAFSKLI